MTKRQIKLLEYHKDIAQFACTGENNVLWVLDLTDPIAFQLAEAHETTENLVANRDKQLAAGCIPALTLTTPLAKLNCYRTEVMEKPPIPRPPEGIIYIVVCTEERILAAATPSMATT
jgi:hypothetical protein